MKKHTIFLLATMLFCFSACEKDDAGVFIRVNNNTPEDFKEIWVIDRSFKRVDASAVTSYQTFETAFSIPVATLITHSNDTLYAGLTYYDWYEYLTDGKYTLKVFEDAATHSGYNCVYIKD